MTFLSLIPHEVTFLPFQAIKMPLVKVSSLSTVSLKRRIERVGRNTEEQQGPTGELISVVLLQQIFVLEVLLSVLNPEQSVPCR